MLTRRGAGLRDPARRWAAADDGDGPVDERRLSTLEGRDREEGNPRAGKPTHALNQMRWMAPGRNAGAMLRARSTWIAVSTPASLLGAGRGPVHSTPRREAANASTAPEARTRCPATTTSAVPVLRTASFNR